MPIGCLLSPLELQYGEFPGPAGVGCVAEGLHALLKCDWNRDWFLTPSCVYNANLWQKGRGTSYPLQLCSFYFFFQLFQVLKECWEVSDRPHWCIMNSAGAGSQWVGYKVVLWCLPGLSFGFVNLDSAWTANSKTVLFISLSVIWTKSSFDKCAVFQSEQQNYRVSGYLASVLAAFCFSFFSREEKDE